jgi:glycosyltransferase involved in cell wall biosynthesis
MQSLCALRILAQEGNARIKHLTAEALEVLEAVNACSMLDNRAVLIGMDASRAVAARLTGTERYSREVIAAMVRAAPAQRFRLYFREGDDAQRDAFLATLQGNIEPAILHPSRLWTHIGLSNEITARPPDGLFVPAHVLPAAMARADLHNKVRAVATVHDLGFKHFPQAHPAQQRAYLDLGTRFTVSNAHVIIADSEATKRDVVAFYGIHDSNVRVAYPGPMLLPAANMQDADKVLKKFGLSTRRPFALHVGTLQPRKNLRRLLQAWARLPAAMRDAQLVLAGGAGWGDEAAQLRHDVDALALSQRVAFAGYISDLEKAVLLRAARVYVLPSLYEGFGFPVLEANAAGVPIACSNTSSLPEVAGDAALMFDPTKVDDIAGAIEQLMTDDGLRERLIDAGHANLARFSWEACAGIILDAITKR